ncbi:lysophospholipid acyltransferase family protein [Mucilaginibacter sp. SMC90]|uniref:lysophospholipid acyltransferase family protein n=1 Tax=Mucilaginibacter sp. SMC90 TaxID=2929803 RepID=UPI001FB495DA|nr:lysophospholipid acyltransferase family protein [Mucilaginibacter sp. SMC90]UOE50538.1 lysophospholipid acyltransferase family protein [Mucilaginibacter sp. SMC90]
MIRNKNNFFMNRIVHYYIKWAVGKAFHELLFNDIVVDQNKSILLIGNHFSFWDGLILYCVNDKLLKKKLHVMILEETARKERFLKYVGAFSVKKDSKSIVRSLDYAAELLEDPANLVLMFPQGKLYANFVTNIYFEKGVMRIIEKATGNFQLIFASTFIQYFKHKKPTATVYLKSEPENYAGENIDKLQDAYQRHYEASRVLQTEFDI